MSNDRLVDLFNVRSHNPSFFSVKENAGYCCVEFGLAAAASLPLRRSDIL
jgi:hypothetical protein